MTQRDIHNIRVVFIGMPGTFSTAPLAALLDADVDVRGVIVPATGGRAAAEAVAKVAPPRSMSVLPIINTAIQTTILQLSWEQEIPVYEVTDLRSPAVRALLHDLAPDVIAVACWAWRVPRAVLAIPPLGVLNVHPSLLPAYRGPEPVFWTLRDGLLRTGVTVHQMDADFDTGPILQQVPVDLDDGITDNQILRRCAEHGGKALVDALHGLAHGTLVPQSQPPGGSYAPLPQHDDFALDTSWSARRAYNFMRGAAAWGVPFTVRVGHEELALRAARSYDPAATLPSPYERHAREVVIQFTPGVLHAVET